MVDVAMNDNGGHFLCKFWTDKVRTRYYDLTQLERTEEKFKQKVIPFPYYYIESFRKEYIAFNFCDALDVSSIKFEKECERFKLSSRYAFLLDEDEFTQESNCYALTSEPSRGQVEYREILSNKTAGPLGISMIFTGSEDIFPEGNFPMEL